MYVGFCSLRSSNTPPGERDASKSRPPSRSVTSGAQMAHIHTTTMYCSTSSMPKTIMFCCMGACDLFFSIFFFAFPPTMNMTS